MPAMSDGADEQNPTPGTRQRRTNRRLAVALAALAIAFYLGFIAMQAL